MPTAVEHTVAEYFAALRAMDVERWVATFAPDAVSHDPVGAPPLEGHDALRKFISGVAAGFTTFGLSEDHVFVNGNSAAVKWTGKGIGRNGKPVTFEGIDVMDCNEEGKIALVRAFWNPAPMMAILRS